MQPFFDQYDNLSQIPNDMVTFIVQIMENYHTTASDFLRNNRFYLHEIKANTFTIPIDDFYDTVIQWEPCYCRGRKHIENMKLDYQDGIQLPPVVYKISKGLPSPIDGRHRIIAAKELGFSTIESFSLDDIVEQILVIIEND